MTVNVMRKTQRKVGEPVTDMTTRERNGEVAINKMSSLGSAWDLLNGSASGDMNVDVTSW